MRRTPGPTRWRVRRALHYRVKGGAEQYVPVGEICEQVQAESLDTEQRAALQDRWLVEQAAGRQVRPIAVLLRDVIRYVVPGDHVDPEPYTEPRSQG